MGARAGYSVMNGAFITIICVTGTLAWISWAVPIDAGMAIVLWIGIVISAQAFQATPREHAPAVVVGLLPGIGAWAALMAKNGLKAAGMGTAARPFTEALVGEFQKSDTWIHGVFSLEQGFLFTSMLLSAAVVGVIERKWTVAAAWCAVAAVMSATGIMHSYQWTDADTVLKLSPAWPFAIAYAVMAPSSSRPAGPLSQTTGTRGFDCRREESLSPHAAVDALRRRLAAQRSVSAQGRRHR